MAQNRELAAWMSRQFDELRNWRRPWEHLWEDSVNVVLPTREFTFSQTHTFDTDRPGGRGTFSKRIGENIYDGSPVSALQLLADGLQGHLVSESIRWFAFRFENDALNLRLENREWLDEVERLLYRAFNRSNFYDQIGQIFLDGGAVGTATMFLEEDLADQRLVFNARHPIEIYIAENHLHKVDRVWRRFFLTARAADLKFGRENLSRAINNSLDKNREDRFAFLHMVEPNSSDIEGLGGRRSQFADARGKKFVSVYKEELEEDIVSVGGFNDNPYAVWRWSVASGEPYGYSPTAKALVDILKLNVMGKSITTAAQLAVEPPVNVPIEQRGRVRIRPGGKNYYEEDASRIISPVNLGINYPIGIDQEERVREIIREHFKVDFFLLLSQRQDTEKTATEIIELQGEKAAVLGPQVGRIGTELLGPIIDRVFAIEFRAGRLPPPPPAILAGEKISIDYLGPLAQAQRTRFRSAGILRSLGAIQPLMELPQIGQQIMDIVNFDALARELFDANGMPAKVLRDEDEVEQIRLARQQAMAQQQQIEQIQQLGDVIPKIGKAPEAGSLGEQVQEQVAEPIQEGG